VEIGEDKARVKISKDGKVTRIVYSGDDMDLYNVNLSCLEDQRFVAAYSAAVNSGHHFSGNCSPLFHQ